MLKFKLKSILNLITIILLFYLVAPTPIFAQKWKQHLNKGKNYLDNYYFKEKQALKELQKAYRLNPNNPKVIFWLGRAYYENQMYEKAESLLEKAVELSPKNAEAHAYLAYTYGRLGEANISQQPAYKSKALRRLNKALKLNSKYYQAYLAWGIGYHYLKMYQAAITSYKKALSINPKDPWIYVQLGRTYLALGKTSKAKTVFNKAVSLASKQVRGGLKYTEPVRAIAIYYEEFGMFKEGLAMAKKALSWNPKDIHSFPNQSIKRVIKRLKQEIKTGHKIKINVNKEI